MRKDMRKIIDYIKKGSTLVLVIQIVLVILAIRFKYFIWGIQMALTITILGPKHFERFSGNHEDYPKDDLQRRAPKMICKLMEPYYYDEKGGIPKEAINVVKYELIILIFSIMILELIVFNPLMYCRTDIIWIICLSGVLLSLMTEDVLYILFKFKKFLNVHIRLTLYNIKYIFFRSQKDVTKKRGDCKIISQYKIRNRKYVNVEMIEDEKIVKRVAVPKEILKDISTENNYQLYERSRVLYIAKENDFRLRF